MASEAQSTLTSPTYKLGKRALQAIQDAKPSEVDTFGGPLLKRPFVFESFQVVAKATQPTTGFVGCSLDTATQHARSGAHVADADAANGGSSAQLDGAQLRGPGMCMQQLLLGPLTGPRMAQGKNAADLLHDMHQTPKSKLRPSAAVFSAPQPQHKQQQQQDPSSASGDVSTPATTLLYRREQLGLRMGALALNSGPSPPPASHAQDGSSPESRPADILRKALANVPHRQPQLQPHAGLATSTGAAHAAREAAASGSLTHPPQQQQQQLQLAGADNERSRHAVAGVPVGMPGSTVPVPSGSGMAAGTGVVPAVVEGVPVAAAPSWLQYQSVVEELCAVRAERDQSRTAARKQRKQLTAQSDEVQRLKQQVGALAQGKQEALAQLEQASSDREALRVACQALTQQLISTKSEQQVLSNKVGVLEATVEAQQDEHDQLSRQLELQYEVEARSRRRAAELELRCGQLKLHLRHQHGMVGHLSEQVRQLGSQEELGAGEDGDAAGGQLPVNALNFDEPPPAIATPNDNAM